MTPFSPRIAPWFSILCSILTCSAATAQDVRIIPVTPENTRLADASPLPEKLESIGWKWLPGEGSGGGIESVPAEDGRSAILMVKAAALEPGAVYEVFGFFWADEALIEGAAALDPKRAAAGPRETCCGFQQRTGQAIRT